jgi:hypothetical protein
MTRTISSFAVTLVACALSSAASAVCLDDAGVSGYHIPLEKEFAQSDLVFVGRVLSERQTPNPPQPRDSAVVFDPGHTYTVEVTEVFRGSRRKRVELFAEYNSGQFPMDIGKTYLVFASARGGLLSASPCGSAGEVNDRRREIAQVRKLASKESK